MYRGHPALTVSPHGYPSIETHVEQGPRQESDAAGYRFACTHKKTYGTAKTGGIKNQITKGDWVVRGINFIDETNRQIWFLASGVNPGEEPYFVHAYRINFDGSGLMAFTSANANHSVSYSADRQFYVDTYSRADLPQASELHKSADASKVADLEKGDATALLAAGWKMPEVFTAMGRGEGRGEMVGVQSKSRWLCRRRSTSCSGVSERRAASVMSWLIAAASSGMRRSVRSPRASGPSACVGIGRLVGPDE